jgi:hypothetical protein
MYVHKRKKKLYAHAETNQHKYVLQITPTS